MRRIHDDRLSWPLPQLEPESSTGEYDVYLGACRGGSGASERNF